MSDQVEETFREHCAAIVALWELRPDSEAHHDVLFLGRQLERAERTLEQEREALRIVGRGTSEHFVQQARALASSPDAAAPDLLTRDEKVSLRTAVSCLAEDYPHASGLPHAESALRKLRATQADTDATAPDVDPPRNPLPRSFWEQKDRDDQSPI